MESFEMQGYGAVAFRLLLNTGAKIMSPTKDLENPSPIDVPDEPVEPNGDEDLGPEIPAGDGLAKRGVPFEEPDQNDADHDSDVEDPIEDRSNLPRNASESEFDDSNFEADGGDPLVQKGPLAEDVPDNEKYPTL